MSKQESHKTNKAGLVLLAATTLVVAACSSNSNDDPYMPPAAGNTAPVISAVTDKISAQDTVVGPIDFGITDGESAVSTLTVAATADANSVFPADGVMLTGSGATRSLTLTPLEAATGTTTISLTVTDPQGMSASRTFKVTVNARSASMRTTALDTFAKAEADDQTAVNGITFEQDADDPAVFAALIPVGDE
jgi:hypothetical protein